MSKKELCITLSKLKTFENPKMELEQYSTDSEIAGDSLWKAHMIGDIEEKTVLDLGAGTGILGLGACLLGAKKTILIEKDKKAIELAEENKQFLESEMNLEINADIIETDIFLFDKKADIVFMNPPFGTKEAGADAKFLLKAFELAPIIYSFHKASTKKYIDKLAFENRFKTTHYYEYDFPLKKTMFFHKKRIERIRVGFWRMEKN